MRPDVHPTCVRSLCLFLATTAISCSADDRLVNPTSPGSVAIANSIASVSPPVNFTQNIGAQDFAAISGSVVVWVDWREGPAALYGCDISGGLDQCAAGAIKLSAGTVDNFYGPSASGGVAVWSDGADIWACTVTQSVNGCLQTRSIIAPPAGGSTTRRWAPRIWHGIAAWNEAASVPDRAKIVACVVTACSSTATTLSLGGTRIAITNRFVVWYAFTDGTQTHNDLFGCDYSTGLAACSQNVVNLTQSPTVEDIEPGGGGDFVAWTPIIGGAPGGFLMGCDLRLSGATCIAPVPLLPVFGVGTPPASDGRILAFQAFGQGIVACDFIAGLGDCGTGTLTSGQAFSRDAAVEGDVVVWTGCNNCDQGGSGGDLEIFGAKVTLSSVPPPPPPPTLIQVVLTPATVSLATGATQQFSVSGRWSDGTTTAPSVTYTATGGTITPGGLYTAGQIAGDYEVTATQQGGTLAGRASVTLTAPPPPPPTLIEIVLTPATASLAPGAAQQFSVSGRWSDGTTTAPAVTYTATGGTITPGGLYTAGQIAGNYEVTATQQGGTLAGRASVTVTAPPPPAPEVAFSVTPVRADFGNVRKNSSRSQSFTVKNLGSRPIAGSVSVTAPFAAVVTDFAVNVGDAPQAVQIILKPPAQGLFKGFGVFTVGQISQSVTLIGERFGECRQSLLADWKKWWNHIDYCDLLTRLRDPNEFSIQRDDPTTGLIATDTELFEYLQRHGVNVQAVVLQVDYGKTIVDFVDSDGCLGPAHSEYLSLVKAAVAAKGIYTKVALVLRILRDDFSGVVLSSLAVDIGLMQISFAAQTIPQLKCHGQQDAGIQGVRTPMQMYIGQREQGYEEHQAFIDATSATTLPTLSKSLQMPEADLEVFFQFAYRSYHLYKDAALKKAIGRGIAGCAVEEWEDRSAGRPVDCSGDGLAFPMLQQTNRASSP